MKLNTPPESPQGERSCEEILDIIRYIGPVVITYSMIVACAVLIAKCDNAYKLKDNHCLRLIEAIDPNNPNDITLEQLCKNTELRRCFYNFSNLPEETAEKKAELRATHGLEENAHLFTVCDRFEKK